MNYTTIRERIPNGRGLNIASELYIPGSTDVPHPTVFLFHGFTGYKEGADLVDLSKKLAEHGIVAIRFTATGLGDSDGTTEHDYLFSNYRKDADVVYGYFCHEPFVDTAHIGVFGHSLGGALTVLFASDHPEIRALCAVSPVASFRDTYYGSIESEWKRKGYFEKISSRDGKTLRIPYAFFTDIEKPEHDILRAAKMVSGKKALVIAGDQDTEVPMKESERVFGALASRAEFRVIPGMVHKYRSQPDIMERVNQSITAFFEGSLIGGAL